VLKALRRNAPTWIQQIPSLSETASPTPLAGASPTSACMLRELAQALPLLTQLRPLILLIEDLQWSDPATLAAISYLARQSDTARLLILGTFRPQEVRWTRHPLWEIEQSLTEYRLCEEVVLQHLCVADVAHYLDVRFPQHRFPANLAPRLHSETSGHPLLLRHVVEALVKDGVLRDVNGGWQLGVELQLGTWEPPPSITALVATEILRLSDFERNVLEAASIAGHRFRVAAVANALGVDPLGVEEVCNRWLRIGRFFRAGEVAQTNGRPRELRCEFVHSLYAQVIKDLIPRTRQIQLQARMGRALRCDSHQRSATH
jgi:predicted ATPase